VAKAKLAEYEAKRDFTKTAEPSGQAEVLPSNRLRFVIQKHAATRLHYDVRLEHEGVFLSWAVTRGPSLDPKDKRLSVETEPHPLDYGDFEGTIPKGEYGGGTVMLWDRGFWDPDPAKPIEEGLKHGHLLVRFEGERLNGTWHLIKLKNDRSGGKRTNWLMFKGTDGAERPGANDELLTKNLTSIASGRTMEEIAAGVGKSPSTFMTAGKSSAKAVWKSNRSQEGEPKGPLPTPEPAEAKAKPTKAKPKAEAKGKSKAKGVEMPDFVEPQTCKLVGNAPPGGGWAHEIKFDGYRMQMRVQGGRAILRSRSGLDWTHRFPEIAADASDWPDCLVDGEIVALDAKSMPSFPGLTTALSTGKTGGLVYYVFDLLFQEGLDLRELPLTERKQRLAEMMDPLEGREGRLRYVDHFITPGEAVLQSACRMDLEGIVSKRVEAPYRSGRGESWVKSKCRAGQEVVIAGWTAEGERFRSLVAGVHRDGKLTYVGRIGTGYTRDTGMALLKRLKPLETASSPFGKTKIPRTQGEVHWIEPQLVAEIEFAGWTADGHIRQASFKGLREDKPPADVVHETERDIARSIAPEAAHDAVEDAVRAAAEPSAPGPKKAAASKAAAKAAPAKAAAGKSAAAGPGGSIEVRRVTITKAEKVLWPSTKSSPTYTKGDLARYLEAVGERMLPHFRGRPVSIVRTPEGIEGERFFQRHAMPGQSPLISLMDFQERKPYIAADTVEALLALGQVGSTEMHPWNNHPFEPENPGRFVFDLDPDEGLTFDDVITAAKDVRDRLTALGLVSFCKTTGGKGLHVVTPLTDEGERIDWPTAKTFAREVCRQLADEQPDKYVLNMAKKARTGRIFLDYLRNDRMATAVGPYSPRARDGATVSMPITWKEVKKGLDPKAYTIATVPKLLKKTNPWEGYDEAARPLSEAIEKLATRKTAKAA
jgi:bifunctional non-homologous end joining protein LigD